MVSTTILGEFGSGEHIPKGWQIFSLGQACTKVTDGTHDTPVTIDEGRPYITAIHVKNGRIDFASCLYLSEIEHEKIYRRCNPEKGDLVVVNIGAGVGECGFVSTDFEFSMKNVALLKPKPTILAPEFLFNSHRFRKNRIAHVVKSGGAQPFLSLRDLRSLPILLPPLPEQRKIAAILSTWDKAIETTEALLATARDQKRALMQSLLTGKRRFPEFVGEEWNEVRLGDIIECLDNKRVPLNSGQRAQIKGDIPYWGANGIVDYINDYIFDEPLVLLAEDGGYFDEFATRPIASISYGKAWVNNHAHILRAKSVVNTEWLYFSLVHKNIMGFINSGTRSKLNKGDMLKIPMVLPTINEQRRIAEIIGIAANEANRLENTVDKLRTEKKALMQQLLTGKRRVAV